MQCRDSLMLSYRLYNVSCHGDLTNYQAPAAPGPDSPPARQPAMTASSLANQSCHKTLKGYTQRERPPPLPVPLLNTCKSVVGTMPEFKRPFSSLRRSRSPSRSHRSIRSAVRAPQPVRQPSLPGAGRAMVQWHLSSPYM